MLDTRMRRRVAQAAPATRNRSAKGQGYRQAWTSCAALLPRLIGAPGRR
jgi:hypothetical protein